MQHWPQPHNIRSLKRGAPVAGPQLARVRDMNKTGALLEALQGLEPGWMIHLKPRGYHLTAVVLWTEGGITAISFLPHITAHQVSYMPLGSKVPVEPAQMPFHFPSSSSTASGSSIK